MSTGVAVARGNGEVTQVPLDEANAYFSDPSGVVASPDGKRAYVASGGSDVVTVLDLDRLAAWLAQADEAERGDAIGNMALSYRYVVARIPTGCNPQHLALSPDGSRLFVAERLDDSGARCGHGQPQAGRPDRAGRRRARRPHPPGRAGLHAGALHVPRAASPAARATRTATWTGSPTTSTAAGLATTCWPTAAFAASRALNRSSGTARIPTLQFQDGPRFARVLMRTDAIPEPQLDQLATFISHLPPTRTTPVEPGRASRSRPPRSADASSSSRRSARTERRFHGRSSARPAIGPRCSRTGCSPRWARKESRDTSGVFDTPHLIGVGAMAPYLHDGRAKTLEEIWTVYQTDDLHGVSSYWSKEQLNDLVEYLKTL